LILLAVPVFGQSIGNPGFEQDVESIPPWEEYGDAVVSDPDNNARIYQPPTFGINEAREGTNIYGAARDGIAMSGGIRQRITGLAPGTYSAVSGWVYTSPDHGRVRFGVDRAGGDNPEVDGIVFLPFTSSGGEWSRVLLPFVASGSSATLFVEYRLSGSGFGLAYVDDFDLVIDPDLSTDCGVGSRVNLSLGYCGVDIDTGPEAAYTVPPGYVITGLGFRAFFQDVTTIRVAMRELLPDGTLGSPFEVRGGVEPGENLEVNVDLPPCYVMVGFGARAAAETDITTMAVWGRPILTDGSLGPIEEFRSGSEPDHGLENQFIIAAENRAMTGAGLRTSFGDVTGMYVESCEIVAESFQPATIHPY
jgi:hypothetical protein